MPKIDTFSLRIDRDCCCKNISISRKHKCKKTFQKKNVKNVKKRDKNKKNVCKR